MGNEESLEEENLLEEGNRWPQTYTLCATSGHERLDKLARAGVWYFHGLEGWGPFVMEVP